MLGRKKKLVKALTTELDKLKEENSEAFKFLKKIEEGDFEQSEQESEHLLKDNSFYEGLLSLQQKLKHNYELEQQQKWEMEGLANFSELLRTSANDENYHSIILSWIVKYLKVNQGALFLINDNNSDDIFLELTAAFAFDRKKFLTKRMEVGQGLVGQCYLEKDIIYLTQIPQDYVHITSGLGDANPNSILLAPLISDEKVVGVIEFASFNEFPAFKREFIKKLGESMAGTFNAIKINKRTEELLSTSKAQTEELREAEEELRQNMEEIKATQEELNRQLRESNVLRHELEARQQVLNLTTILSEADPFGTIIFANKKLSEVSQYSMEEMIGKPHNLFRHPDMPKELFKIMWTTIKSGAPFRGVVKNRAKDGTHYWVDATIAPVFDDSNKIVKYIGMRYVIPDDSLAEIMFEKCKKDLGL